MSFNLNCFTPQHASIVDKLFPISYLEVPYWYNVCTFEVVYLYTKWNLNKNY